MRADNSLVFESPSYVLGEHFIVRKEASGGQRGSRKRRLRRAPGCIWEALCGDRRGRISRAVRDLGGNDPTATLTHRAANGGSLPPRPRFGPRLSLLRFLASLFFSPDSLHCFCCFCLTRQGRNSRETTARVGRRPARQRVAPSTPSPVGFCAVVGQAGTATPAVSMRLLIVLTLRQPALVSSAVSSFGVPAIGWVRSLPSGGKPGRRNWHLRSPRGRPFHLALQMNSAGNGGPTRDALSPANTET